MNSKQVTLLLSCIQFLLLKENCCNAFSSFPSFVSHRRLQSRLCMIYAPPGSGYARPEDEKDELPDTYVPMMEYPGTMRPGRTPENMPYHDLPIGDDDPDPVPWPHFQQIEWHHRWDPPHDHPIPMEEFIELQGRWATPEMEAAMRAGVRRDVRERRAKEEAEKRETLIMDDADDDGDEIVELGDGIFGQLGSTADQAITAAAVAPPDPTKAAAETKTEEDDASDDDDLDDFLLELGLDLDVDEEPEDDKSSAASRKKSSGGSGDEGVDLDMDLGFLDDSRASQDKSARVTVDSAGGETATINVDDDDDLDLGLDDDDDLTDDGVSTVPLDDFGDGDSLDGDDIFDDGGFDFDDDGGDGGDFDMW